jgi:hypothetical protein
MSWMKILSHVWRNQLITSKNFLCWRLHIARWHLLCQSTIKPRWYGRGEGTSYAIVQYFPSCVRSVAVGVACSRSGATVPVGPVDASEGEIHAAENYVAMRNWTQDLSSDTMLDDTSSASPTIKPRWYGRGEGASYTIVQHSPSWVRAAAVGTAYSCSGAVVPVSLADASKGGIRVTENCVAREN